MFPFHFLLVLFTNAIFYSFSSLSLYCLLSFPFWRPIWALHCSATHYHFSSDIFVAYGSRNSPFSFFRFCSVLHVVQSRNHSSSMSILRISTFTPLSQATCQTSAGCIDFWSWRRYLTSFLQHHRSHPYCYILVHYFAMFWKPPSCDIPTNAFI